jgi:YHS domain-containing protein
VVRFFLILIVLLLIARALWRLLGGIVAGAAGESAGRRTRPASPPAMKMARDPICGTYVVPGKALELARGQETTYFCSSTCRDEWVRRAH